MIDPLDYDRSIMELPKAKDIDNVLKWMNGEARVIEYQMIYI